MRLLVITYAMDEAAVTLAWQVRVVRELAKRCEHVTVLTESLGKHAVPGNTFVEQFDRPRLSIPIVRGLVRRLAMIRQTRRLCRTYSVQAVFLHMAHRYAYLLYPVFRRFNLPVLLWYAHGTVTWHLRMAHACVDRVISSTPEGFRVRSQKAYFIGQGVDIDLFTLPGASGERHGLVAVSRVSRRKRLDVLLGVMRYLRSEGLKLKIVGSPITNDDVAYERELRNVVSRECLPVEFVGLVPMQSLPPVYQSAALQLHVSQTNSLDKAPLEGLACGCPVLTSNPALREVLSDYPDLLIREETPEAIAAQVRDVLARRHAFAPQKMRALVAGHHDLRSYADHVMEHLKAITA